MRIVSLILLALLSAAPLPAAATSPASGIRFDRSINVRPAANFWYAPIQSSDSSILAFDERQGVSVPDGILRVQKVNRWDNIADLEDRAVGREPVNSHMVYFDKATKGRGRVTLEAEIEFADLIVGFVADDRLFAATNPLFAPNPTHKEAPGKAPWSLEEKQSWTSLDEVTLLSPTRLRLKWSNESATDPLRVFTTRAPLPAAALQPVPPAAAPVTLLFVGSSSAYWNDLPREVARAVDRRVVTHPDAPIVPAIVGRSGSDIRVYLEPGFNRYEYGVKPGQTFLQKIAEERPPLVALMTVTQFITGRGEGDPTGQLHRDAISRYCAAIRAGGGEPIFYEMGWGKSERDAEGRRHIVDLAVKNGVRFFAPCSSAWARVYRERPDLALQDPKDNSHPGDAGHFLNVACFTAALTRESPVGRLPRTFPVWPHGLPKAETEEQKAAEAARIAAFKPDAYQATLAKWTYRNASMNLTATLDEATARYLETVAWETWLEVDRRLAAALAR